MKKYFVSSDIHSYYSMWMNDLKEAGFDINNKEHILIVLGDLFDRGCESNELLNFIVNFDEERIILIKGNHEDLLDELIYRGFPLSHDFHNCTIDTVFDLFEKKIPTLDEFRNHEVSKIIDRMKDYYETKNYIFVHGYIPVIYDDFGLPEYNENWREASSREWKDARWLNGMSMGDNRGIGIHEKNKTIVFGHFSTRWGHVKIEKEVNNSKDMKELFRPFISDGIIGLDSCNSVSGFINILVLNEDEL